MIGNQIGANKPGEQSGDKKYDPNGWRFFSPAGGQRSEYEAQTVRRAQDADYLADLKGKDGRHTDQGFALPYPALGIAAKILRQKIAAESSALQGKRPDLDNQKSLFIFATESNKYLLRNVTIYFIAFCV